MQDDEAVVGAAGGQQQQRLLLAGAQSEAQLRRRTRLLQRHRRVARAVKRRCPTDRPTNKMISNDIAMKNQRVAQPIQTLLLSRRRTRFRVFFFNRSTTFDRN